MFRRHLLALTCLALGGSLATICAFMGCNFVQLAQAQTFAEAFVRRAVDQGSRMPLPTVAPGATTTLSPRHLSEILDRAQRIGPVVDIAAASCAVQTDPQNLCAGQLMACVVAGTGALGGFEATLAMCRGGDLAPYRLAASMWRFRFNDGDPAEVQDRSHI